MWKLQIFEVGKPEEDSFLLPGINYESDPITIFLLTFSNDFIMLGIKSTLSPRFPAKFEDLIPAFISDLVS